MDLMAIECWIQREIGLLTPTSLKGTKVRWQQQRPKKLNGWFFWVGCLSMEENEIGGNSLNKANTGGQAAKFWKYPWCLLNGLSCTRLCTKWGLPTLLWLFWSTSNYANCFKVNLRVNVTIVTRIERTLLSFSMTFTPIFTWWIVCNGSSQRRKMDFDAICYRILLIIDCSSDWSASKVSRR